jgi:hypothetical protein
MSDRHTSLANRSDATASTGHNDCGVTGGIVTHDRCVQLSGQERNLMFCGYCPSLSRQCIPCSRDGVVQSPFERVNKAGLCGFHASRGISVVRVRETENLGGKAEQPAFAKKSDTAKKSDEVENVWVEPLVLISMLQNLRVIKRKKIGEYQILGELAKNKSSTQIAREHDRDIALVTVIGARFFRGYTLPEPLGISSIEKGRIRRNVLRQVFELDEEFPEG